MAGSERVNKAGLDSGPRWRDCLSANAFINNFGLQQFSHCCQVLSDRKTPIEGGKKIQADCPWTFLEHTKALKSIFNGTSLCGYVFCVSQAMENSGETWCTLRFGKVCQKVRSNVIKPKEMLLEKAIQDAEKGLAKAKKELDSMNDN